MSDDEIPQLAGEEDASHFFGVLHVHPAAEGLDEEKFSVRSAGIKRLSHLRSLRGSHHGANVI
jgi:hypothetical protein